MGPKTRPEIADGTDTNESMPEYLASYFQRDGSVATAHGPVLGPECFGPSDRPAAHQEDVRRQAAALASGKTAKRGLLVWHSTGTGKTCTAAIAMDAFWKTKRDLVYVTTASALALGPLAKLQRCASQKMAQPEDAYARRGVRAMSFEELAAGALPTAETALVVDEAHHLLEPRFLALAAALMAAPASIALVALTATPGPFPEATLMLLNMLRPAGSPPYALPKAGSAKEGAALAARLRRDGVVAYYDAVNDAEHFPEVRVVDSSTKGATVAAKVAQMVDEVAAAPGDRHMVWAPDAEVGAAAADGLRAANVRFVEIRGDVSQRAREFNKGTEPGVALIADRGLGEAVDLRGVRHVHVLDAELDADGLKQVVGRAYRFCSHAFLPEQDWTVEVKLYLPRVPGRVDVAVTRLEEVAAHSRELLVLLVGLTDEVGRKAGVADLVTSSEAPSKAVDAAVRKGLAALGKDEAQGMLKVWADLPKLRREVDALAKQLSEADLRTLASVHEADARLSREQRGSDDANRAFYDLLRAAGPPMAGPPRPRTPRAGPPRPRTPRTSTAGPPRPRTPRTSTGPTSTGPASTGGRRS